jgi:hypothetical protein
VERGARLEHVPGKKMHLYMRRAKQRPLKKGGGGLFLRVLPFAIFFLGRRCLTVALLRAVMHCRSTSNGALLREPVSRRSGSWSAAAADCSLNRRSYWQEAPKRACIPACP